MMKKIRKYIALTLLAALPASHIANLHAGHGWGWGGFGAGLFTGALVGGLASRGGGGGGGGRSYSYWQVYNDTQSPLLVRGSGTGKQNFIYIAPGQTMNIPQGKKPKIYAKFEGDKRERPSSAMMYSPYVTISAPNNTIQFMPTPQQYPQQGYSGPQPPQGGYYPGPYPPNGYY